LYTQWRMQITEYLPLAVFVLAIWKEI